MHGCWVKPWASSRALYWETFASWSQFSHKHPFITHWINSFWCSLNWTKHTFHDFKDFISNLVVSSHMGQSLRLQASITVVRSQSSSKYCEKWKQKALSMFTNVRSYTFDCNLCWVNRCLSFIVIQLNIWEHTFACPTYLCLGVSFARLKISTMTSLHGCGLNSGSL